jgi:outer membrane lipoprotein-sorting protein
LTKISSTIIFITLIAGSAFCQGNTLIDRIKANYSGKTALSATVDIRIVWKVREKTDTRRGSIQLAPGDKFRVDLGNMLWVSDGTTLWQYDKKLSQVAVQSLSEAGSSMLPSQAIADYCSKYSFVRAKSTGREAVLEWKADSAAAAQAHGAVHVVITADSATAVVRQALITDGLGNETSYTFSNTVFGRTEKPATFAFTTPKGARVIDKR